MKRSAWRKVRVADIGRVVTGRTSGMAAKPRDSQS